MVTIVAPTIVADYPAAAKLPGGIRIHIVYGPTGLNTRVDLAEILPPQLKGIQYRIKPIKGHIIDVPLGATVAVIA